MDDQLNQILQDAAGKLSGSSLLQTQGFDEVVDSISDLIEVGIAVDKALADGFQVADLFVAIDKQDEVREVINDFPVFFAQFKDLNPAESLQAVTQIRDRITRQGEPGRVTAFILDVLSNLASTHGFVQNVITQGMAVFNGWKQLRIEPRS